MKKEYTTAVKVFKEFAPNQQVPTFESIQKALTDKQKKYIEKNDCFLVITPALNLYNIIQNFDDKQKVKTYIYHELWDQYKSSSELRVDFVPSQVSFTNQTLQEQRESIKKAKKSLGGLTEIDPRTYMMAQAIRREQNIDFLDKSTWQRFPQFEEKVIDGYTSGPVSFWNPAYGQVDVSRDDVGFSDGNLGVRLPVWVKPLDFEISSAAPLDLFQQTTDYLFEKGHTINKPLVEDIVSFIEEMK